MTDSSKNSGFKYYDGLKPEKYWPWKQTVQAYLLPRKKETDGTHDTTTWGPHIIKFLKGDAAAIFEDADIESRYSIRDGQRVVWTIVDEAYPKKP